MHTPAAELQSLHKHSFAYVKQYPHSAKIKGSFVALVLLALVLFVSACVTLPRRASEGQANLTSREAATVRVKINSATSDELEKLPGIGKVIAERIIEHRNEFGPFRRAEHLMMVHGISDQKFRAMREMVVVE